MSQAKIVGTSVLCEYPDGKKALLGMIEVDCPLCGKMQYVIPGHHMRVMLRQLAEWVEQFPEETGSGEIQTLEKTAFSGPPKGDPNTN